VKVVGYIRVSTEEQSREGVSLENQKERIENYAKAKGWNLIKVYSDPGYSGKDLKRPGIQELIQDIREKKFEAVIVYKVDRLTRKQRDLYNLLEGEFETHGVGFVSITETFDTTTATGKAFLGMLGVFNQLERDTISDRTKDALAHKIDKGEPVGHAPIGFHYAGKQLEEEPEKLELVKRVFDLRKKPRGKKRLSYVMIAQKLNEEGLRPIRGKMFYCSTVYHILKNPVYNNAFN